MKPLVRNSVRIAVCVVAFAIVLGGAATSVNALLNDVPNPVLTSPTNPGSILGAGDTVDTWWREGWGSSPYPEFTLTLPSVMTTPVPEYVLGILYTVDRNPATVIVPGSGGYFITARGSGTHLSQVIDLAGSAGPGNPVDGQWYLHYKFYSTMAYATTQIDVPFGIDTAPPSP
jgi:hypothetical protein